MKPITLASLALVASTQLFAAFAAAPPPSQTTLATPGKQSPSALPVQGQLTPHGCYNSGANLTETAVEDNVSGGSCYNACKAANYYVSGLHGTKCYCGMVYPPIKDLLSDDKCNYPCPGYGKEACGALGGTVYSIFNTGIEVDVEDYSPPGTTTTSATPTSAPTKTSAAETSVVTETDNVTPTSTPKEEKKGPNVAAIAAGVVVGVVVLGAGIGALFFVVRRKRNAEIEEEHRRNAAVNAFINGSKPPGSSGSISMTDSRLDPVMAHRRMSDGSIADNQDYSRRILRVTNA
jgi:cell wall integrity and stress response component